MNNQKICIDTTDDNFSIMLSCAVRYALGRRTYVPSSVCAFITPLIPKLLNKTLWCMERDISEAYSYGDEKNRQACMDGVFRRDKRRNQ